MRKSRQTRKVMRRKRLRQNKSGFIIRKRQRPISVSRLERGLRVLSETNDISVAARSIRVSPERFKLAAKPKHAIRKRGGRWIVARRLTRQMPIFSNGKQYVIKVRATSASLIGRYMSAVRQFLRTNKPDVLAEFKGRSAKDTGGKSHQFETDPNVLYRLSSAGGEPFEDIYRIIL